MIGIILTLVLIGVILYLVETYIPMSPPIPMIIRIVVVVCVVLWLLQIFGGVHILDVPPPHV